VEDIFPGRGPLAAIHAALASSAHDLNLILAVDVPLLTAGFLTFIVERASAARALVTVPRSGGGYHPLCAVYRKGFVDVAETALTLGQNKVDALFPRVTTLAIEEAELETRGFSPAMFRNLNTKEDLGAAEDALQAIDQPSATIASSGTMTPRN
jgi:molybdopterin-guanine dinucleotide biosynthesis protein A